MPYPYCRSVVYCVAFTLYLHLYCLYPRSDDPSLARPPPVAPTSSIYYFIYLQSVSGYLLASLLAWLLALSLSLSCLIHLSHSSPISLSLSNKLTNEQTNLY